MLPPPLRVVTILAASQTLLEGEISVKWLRKWGKSEKHGPPHRDKKTLLAHTNMSIVFSLFFNCESPGAFHQHRLANVAEANNQRQRATRSTLRGGLRPKEPRMCATRPLPAGETQWCCLLDRSVPWQAQRRITKKRQRCQYRACGTAL